MTYGDIVILLGGVGLLLLGMRLMSDGLKVAAGARLRELLARSTTTRPRAVASGFTITALVQSSSAVIFAIIGFVNAGLLALPAAIGVIYGANLGTTVTSWLVALVGFKLELKLIAMPAIAVGMALRVAFGNRRHGALGVALAGFGVFFVGVDLMKEAFAGLEAPGWADPDAPVHHLLGYAGIGFLMTLVMQSSSATIALTLAAAASGLLPLPAAAAMVVGADVGTTSTAALASLGATSAARRAAAAHVLFNLVLALVALPLLPALLWLVAPLEPATALAAFHSLTKLLALALLWPLTTRVTAWLQQRFRSRDEDTARPRFLDRNVAGTPSLAVNALARELERAGELARSAAAAAVDMPAGGAPQLIEDCAGLQRLLEAINDFAGAMNRDRAYADPVARALRIRQYLADAAERAAEYGERGGDAAPTLTDPEAASAVRGIGARAAAVLRAGDDAGTVHEAFESDYQAAKALLLRTAAEGRVPVRQMVAVLERLSTLRRLVDQLVKADMNQRALRDEVAPP